MTHLNSVHAKLRIDFKLILNGFSLFVFISFWLFSLYGNTTNAYFKEEKLAMVFSS